MFSLARLKGDFTVVFNMLPRASRGAHTDLFILMTSDSTRGKGRELS